MNEEEVRERDKGGKKKTASKKFHLPPSPARPQPSKVQMKEWLATFYFAVAIQSVWRSGAMVD
jgi:hypothetical protein